LSSITVLVIRLPHASPPATSSLFFFILVYDRGGIYALVVIRSLRSLRLLRLFRVIAPLADTGEVLVASMGSFAAIGILIPLFW
jgi:hypothetical protein